MDLRHVLSALYRWRLVMIVLFVACVGSASAYAALTPRTFASSTTVYFSLNRSTTVSTLAQGSTYTQDQVKSYSQVVTTAQVLNPVIQKLGLNTSINELARNISVEAQPDTVLATITVTNRSGALAARIANEVGIQLGDTVLALSAPAGADSPGAVRVTTISAAQEPRLPSSPNVPLVLGLGVVVGLGLAVGGAILLELLASPLVDDQLVERDSKIVGKIVYDKNAKSQPLPIVSHSHLPRAESFRSLRTNLRQLERTETAQCLVVTSALPREGRTSVAVNLAIAVAQSQRRVLLIDADLRRPAVAKRLGLTAETGLSDVLVNEARVEDVVWSLGTQTWQEAALLDVLVSGRRAPDPSELFARPVLGDLLDEARKRYDLVVIDTPAVLPVTDGALLAAQADGTLLVVNARTTNERDFDEARTALRLAGARLHGVVFNAVRPRRHAGKGAQLYGVRSRA
jgi:polysaccharide biosynthesis transport protein